MYLSTLALGVAIAASVPTATAQTKHLDPIIKKEPQHELRRARKHKKEAAQAKLHQLAKFVSEANVIPDEAKSAFLESDADEMSYEFKGGDDYYYDDWWKQIFHHGNTGDDDDYYYYPDDFYGSMSMSMMNTVFKEERKQMANLKTE